MYNLKEMYVDVAISFMNKGFEHNRDDIDAIDPRLGTIEAFQVQLTHQAKGEKESKRFLSDGVTTPFLQGSDHLLEEIAEFGSITPIDLIDCHEDFHLLRLTELQI